jgi:DNA-binding winged helix-turn-helix (wHTH) protein
MSVPLLQEWRLPGCGGRCVPRWHDPQAHEAYGVLLALRVMAPRVVRSGPLAVDLDTGVATVDGRDIHLTPTERGILLVLAQAGGRVVAMPDTVTAVWGAEYVPSGRHLMSVNLARLRRRLGRAAGLLVTVTNAGHRLDVLPADAKMPAPRIGTRPLLAQWAREWTACRSCNGIDRPHTAWGYCSGCYFRARTKARTP